MMGSRVPQVDDIYRLPSLHTLPHRWRVRQTISTLQSLHRHFSTYADVGCADGFVTHQIAEALKTEQTVGFELQEHVAQAGSEQYPDISFRHWNLTSEAPPTEKFDLVTCMETLEHVLDLQFALKNLLAITKDTLLITVPVEIGPLGLAKFGAKVLLRRRVFTGEHRGSKADYAARLLRGAPISHFRHSPEHGYWTLHTGFDYRELDAVLRDIDVCFTARNQGWNRLYVVRP
ncbi:MAG TPA: class I SAM-dependent methyltransferase [Candidatus Limnocylindrales bacterium]|nr:class I SAM-dependent methyltransferase [Candidatus Limnocylindrales bacterium]